jgi:hypothetical protein
MDISRRKGGNKAPQPSWLSTGSYISAFRDLAPASFRKPAAEMEGEAAVV